MRAVTKRVSGLVVVSQGFRKEGCTKLVDGLALGFDRVSMGSSRSVQVVMSRKPAAMSQPLRGSPVQQPWNQKCNLISQQQNRKTQKNQ